MKTTGIRHLFNGLDNRLTRGMYGIGILKLLTAATPGQNHWTGHTIIKEASGRFNIILSTQTFFTLQAKVSINIQVHGIKF